MTGARAELLARRRELLHRAAAQRDDLAREFDRIGQTFRGAERVLKVVDTLEGKVPQIAAGAAVVTLLLGPARVSGWVAGIWMVWKTVRSVIASR